MLASFTLDVLAILTGAVGMLWLLLAKFGTWTAAPVVPFEDLQVADGKEPLTVPAENEPFIEMPAHLKTHAEMVAWMTQELPKLTDKVGTKPQRL